MLNELQYYSVAFHFATSIVKYLAIFPMLIYSVAALLADQTLIVRKFI